MGSIANTVKTVGTGVAKVGSGLGQGAGGIAGQKGVIHRLGTGAAAHLDAGSRRCPVASELRGVGEGLAQGDLNKTAFNAGVLALTAASCGGSSKVASSVVSGNSMLNAASVCAVN